jgi:hypothetical protein
MISKEHKSGLIRSSIRFIRSITHCYGTEEGMKLWGQIAEVLDPSLKGEIFFSMISGSVDAEDTITIIGRNRTSIVKSIKALREVCPLGLKEAKDMCEEIDKGKVIKLPCTRVQFDEAQKMLEDAGFQAF